MSAGEIRQLDAGSWFGEQFVGEKVPLLEDVLEQFKGRGIINIELKNFTHRFNGLVQKAIKMVNEDGNV